MPIYAMVHKDRQLLGSFNAKDTKEAALICNYLLKKMGITPKQAHGVVNLKHVTNGTITWYPNDKPSSKGV